MGNTGSQQAAAPAVPLQKTAATTDAKQASGEPTKKPACKACCACPETKKARDQCIMERGEENCKDLIEAHKKCMRDMGFNI